MIAPDRPILRYHGGKWVLAEWIIAHFPAHRIYCEPFGGAASVLLRKPRAYAEIYNDLDGEIVNLFEVVRDHASELTRKIAWTPFSRDEYYAAFEVCDDRVEMARRTMIRAFMGFGSNSINRKVKSGFRSNSNRSGTTPAHDWKNMSISIRAVARRLRGVVIENRPALKLIHTHDAEDALFYIDPPYVHSTRISKPNSHGYAHEMTDAQHRELAGVLNSVRGMVIVSGYECDLYSDLYGGWKSAQKSTYGDGATPRNERLWISPKAWDRLGERSELFAMGGAR